MTASQCFYSDRTLPGPVGHWPLQPAHGNNQAKGYSSMVGSSPSMCNLTQTTLIRNLQLCIACPCLRSYQVLIYKHYHIYATFSTATRTITMAPLQPLTLPDIQTYLFLTLIVSFLYWSGRPTFRGNSENNHTLRQLPVPGPPSIPHPLYRGHAEVVRGWRQVPRWLSVLLLPLPQGPIGHSGDRASLWL